MIGQIDIRETSWQEKMLRRRKDRREIAETESRDKPLSGDGFSQWEVF